MSLSNSLGREDLNLMCVKMAQTQERWVLKVLSLPVFSNEFAQAVLASPYSNLALVSSVEVRSAEEFTMKVHDWSGALEGNAERWKWAAKLEAIGQRAGSASKLLADTENSEALTTSEVEKLRKLVLG